MLKDGVILIPGSIIYVYFFFILRFSTISTFEGYLMLKLSL